jgi:CheY-like chemotaxis protein
VFVEAIRRWASAHGKLVSKSPVAEAGSEGAAVAGSDGFGGGGERGVTWSEEKNKGKNIPGAAFHCPAFILMSWPSYASSVDDINDIGSWGDIGGLNRGSFDSERKENPSGDGRPEDDEEVEDFLSSNEAESLPKPVQHARLQKLLASSAAYLFSSGETSLRATKTEPASSADRPAADAADDLPGATAGGNSNFKPLLPKDMRILLAEDHHINMKVACAVLARCGHKDITIAKDGVEVLEKLAALPSGLDSFDIVLMDLHMPRMGGMECVRQMRLLYPVSVVPIVAVTADAVEESRDRCMSNGFNGWISKPFRIEQLEGLLYEFVPAGKGKAGGG